jgi:ribosomal-protein-alanine N-acetyltransferase
MPFPNEIQTKRLRLHRPVEADAEEIFARYATDPEVTRYLSFEPHRSLDDTLAFLRKTALRRQEDKGHEWLIRSRVSDQLLGSIGWGRCECRVQFGYCLARDAWGHGYATEAASEIVNVALAEPTIWRVEATCDTEHVASARVLEKAGLTFEGTLRRYTVLPNLGDVPRDMRCYAKVRG